MKCSMKPSSRRPFEERAGAKPTVMVFDEPSACAAYTGLQPSFDAASLTRLLVSSETPGRSLIANDTAVCEIPSSSAMSLRPTRCGLATGCAAPDSKWRGFVFIVGSVLVIGVLSRFAICWFPAMGNLKKRTSIALTIACILHESV